MRVLRFLLRPAPHLDRHPAQHAVLTAVGGALALGATVGVAWAAGFENVLHRLRHLDPVWLPVAFGMEAAAYFGYTVAYRELLRVEGGPRIGLGRAGAIVAAGFGVFIIRGGFVVDRQALESAGVVPLGFVAAFAALGFRHRVGDHTTWGSAVAHALDAVHVLRRLAAQPRQHSGAFLGTGLYWLGDIGCLWASLRAFHETPHLPALVIGYATGYALTRRTLPLGGAGSVEALVSFALAWAGIPLAQALLAVCAYRIFNLWLPLLPAAVGLRHLKRWQQQ